MQESKTSVSSLEVYPAWPYYADDEIEAATRVLRSGKVNYWTGDEARQFELEYARSLQVKHSIALANGSVALELPLHHWGIGPGDEVIVTPRSFIASVSCVILLGARPVFADVDLDSGNITAQSIEPLITRKTRAIIPVHLAGWPCDIGPIMALADVHRLKVLEDCAQSHGATYRGAAVGSIGHAGAFSFCQDKIITTGGEGGLLATSDEELWNSAWSFKDHGKTWDSVYNRRHPLGFRWLHDRFGTNLRLTDLQAAIGRLQLRKLGAWIEARRMNAALLKEWLSRIDAIRVPTPPSGYGHAYYKFYAYVRPERMKSGWSRDRILSEVSSCGVPCFSGGCSEIYLEKAFSNTDYRPARFLPNARQLGETSLMFPVHPTMNAEHINRIGETLLRIFDRAKR